MLARGLAAANPSLVTAQALRSVPKSNFSGLNMTAKRIISTTPIKQSGAVGHEKLWLAERILAGGLLALVPVAFIWPSAAGDYMLASTFLVHAYL